MKSSGLEKVPLLVFFNFSVAPLILYGGFQFMKHFILKFSEILEISEKDLQIS